MTRITGTSHEDLYIYRMIIIIIIIIIIIYFNWAYIRWQ
jgi:hypothetical protein